MSTGLTSKAVSKPENENHDMAELKQLFAFKWLLSEEEQKHLEEIRSTVAMAVMAPAPKAVAKPEGGTKKKKKEKKEKTFTSAALFD